MRVFVAAAASYNGNRKLGASPSVFKGSVITYTRVYTPASGLSNYR